MGEPVHPARLGAIPVDLGDGISSGARMGLPGSTPRPGTRRISGSAHPVRGTHRSPRETGQRRAPLMEILLLTIYGALCWIIFKIFRIPVNKWTLPTTVLGG